MALLVYVQDSVLREATQHAIDMWNVAAGQEILTMTNDPGKANIIARVVPQSQLGQSGADADFGGKDSYNTKHGLVLHINVGPTQTGDSTLYATMAHELGHNLGLFHPGTPDDPITGNRYSSGQELLLANGVMGRGAHILPGEAQMALGDQGLGPGFNPSDQSIRNVEDMMGPYGIQEYGDPKEPPTPTSGPALVDYLHHLFLAQGYASSGETKAQNMALLTASNLVAAGLKARMANGAQLGGYDMGRYAQDVRSVADSLTGTTYKNDEAVQGRSPYQNANRGAQAQAKQAKPKSKVKVGSGGTKEIK